MANIAGKVGNFFTDAGAAVSHQVYKGAEKLGKDITLDTAQKIGYGITIGTVAGAGMGLANGYDTQSRIGGTISGAGLGAVGGAGISAVASAIAKGIR